MATEESPVFGIAADDPDQSSELLLPVTPELDISAVGRSFRADAKLAPLEHISLFLPRVNQGRVRKEAVEGFYSLNVPLKEPLECRIDGRYPFNRSTTRSTRSTTPTTSRSSSRNV